MYRDELFTLTLKAAELSLALVTSDLTDAECVEGLAEKAREVELMANELSSELLGLAHFLEEVRQGG